MKIKQLISILLATGHIALVSSCGSQSDSNEQTSAESMQKSDENLNDDVSSDSEIIADNLPEIDFKGAEFRIAYNDYMSSNYNITEETGEILDDSLYNRDRSVEERFNVKLCYSEVPYNGMESSLRTTLAAGDDLYDLMSMHAVTMGTLATEGLFVNWLDVPHVDFANPWWSQSATEALTYKNKVLYTAVGDYALSSVSYTWLMVFDKVAADEFNVPDLYAIVREGEWTLDTVLGITKDIYRDVNGNNERDDGDFYGYVSDMTSALNAFLWSCNNPVMKSNSDGIPEMTFYTEKAVDIIDKAMSLLTENTGAYCDSTYNGYGGGYAKIFFQNAQCMLSTATFDSINKNFRNNTDAYGILPYPKYDETQANYYSQVDGSHEVLSIPITAPNLEMCGIISEALCAETYKTVIPNYVETVLKVKLADDADDAEMADLIIASHIFDFGYIYSDSTGNVSFIMQYIAQKSASDVTSYYASKETSIKTKLEDLFSIFDNLIADE